MALNVNISAIYLGKFADIDTYEGNFRIENAGNLLGSYGTETDPLWTHRVTIDTDSFSSTIDVDHAGGAGTLTYDAGSGTVTTRLDSLVEYDAIITYEDGTQIKVVLDIIQTTSGDVFLLAYDSYTFLDDKPIESITLLGVHDDSWGGFYQTSYDSIKFICFAPGTLITTPAGPARVEMLRPGDPVITRDRGAQPLVWVGRRHLRFPPAIDQQKPIAFRPGSLGPGLPRRALVVSPQHRILLSGTLAARVTGHRETLVKAVNLTGLKGVRRMAGKRAVTYIALMCRDHEVIEAEGVAVETFYPGPAGLATLSAFEVLELRALFPEMRPVRNTGYGPLARPDMSGATARKVVRRLRRAERLTGPL